MKTIAFITATFCVSILVSCFQGPQGPAGPVGPEGKSGIDSCFFRQTTGILYKADMDSTGSYWNIWALLVRTEWSYSINVHVRQGAGFMWTEPQWFWSDEHIRIFTGDYCKSGYEYRISMVICDGDQ
jgi:hypothetical protein